MRTQSLDTSPEIEAKQFELFRKAGIPGRVARMREITATVVKLSQRAWKKRLQPQSEQETLIAWIAFAHGPALAQQLRSRWEGDCSSFAVSAHSEPILAMEHVAAALESLAVPFL